jgi:O-antigen/teichoic acid export membrane protein
MKQIVKYVSLLSISNAITRAISMLFFIVLARLLSVSDYGEFRYLVFLSFIYAVFFSGLTYALTKFISEDETNIRRNSEYVTNTLFISSLSVFIIALIILIFNEYSLFLILITLASFIDYFYIGLARGALDYRKLIGYKLLENIIQLGFVLLIYIIYSKITFGGAVWFYFISCILSMIFFEIFWKTNVSIRFRFLSLEKIRKLIAFAIPVFFGSVGWSIMFSINAVIIKSVLDTEQVGYFSIAFTLAQVFTFIPTAISTIILPKVSGLKNKSNIKPQVTLAVIGNLIISAVILLLLIFFREQIISLIFGEKYLPAAPLIVYLSLGQIFINSYVIFSSVFQGVNRPGIPSLVILLTGIMNLVGSYFIAIPWGVLGVSIVNMLTCLFTFIIIAVIYYSKTWEKCNEHETNA